MSANGSRPSAETAIPSLDLFNPRGFETAVAVANSMLKGWGVISETWIGLWQSQIDSNLQLLQSLAKCDNPVTALTLQLDGARATMTRCVTTATKTSDIASKLAADALAPLRAAAQPTSRAA
jgi:hypothetical protein